MSKESGGSRENTEEMPSRPSRLLDWLATGIRLTRVQKYLLSLLFVAGATVLHWLLEKMLGIPYAYSLYYPAVILASLIGGIGTGLLATALSAFAALYFFIEPYGHFRIAYYHDALALAIFCFNGVFITVIVDRIHRTRAELTRQEALQKAYQELETQVQERTRELTETLEALEAQKQKFLNILNVLPVFMALLTPDRHISFANRMFLQRFGASDGRRCFEHLFGRTEPCAVCNPYEAIKTNGPQEWEWTGPDGHIYSISNFPFTDMGGSDLILEIGVDITNRKRAVEALSRSEERFRRVFESDMIGISFPDRSGRFLDGNDKFLRMVGYSRDDLDSGRVRWDAMTPAEYAPLDAKGFAEADERGSCIPYEKEYIRKDGTRMPVLVGRTVIKDSENQYISFVLDLTEHKQIQEERQQMEEQLWQGQKMQSLGTLAGGIAHDFNNILAAIIGFTEMIKDRVPKESRERRHAQTVLEAAMRGRDVVRQMLTFSRQTEQEKKPMQLSGIVKESVKLLRASIPTSIDIRVSLKSESGVILGDPVQIQRVLMNLAVNAAYAMRENGGTLDMELSDFSVSSSDGTPRGIEPGLYMKLTVRDTGAGMSPDVIDRIFDPFFTTKKAGEGTGLGLSVVLGIVKQSNGYITAESQPGEGATFTVYFPKVIEEPAAEESAGEEAVPTGRERILLVDDEEVLARMGEQVLARLGYAVTRCTSSKEALALFSRDPSGFDLVITDQTMPDMTGIQLAAKLLAIRPRMPIILSTGFSYTATQESAKAAGIKGFAMKPLTKREIAKIVRKVLDEE